MKLMLHAQSVTEIFVGELKEKLAIYGSVSESVLVLTQHEGVQPVRDLHSKRRGGGVRACVFWLICEICGENVTRKGWVVGQRKGAN